jgi:N-acetyl-anhydromuramyl-L-alanine amidase AmpD
MRISLPTKGVYAESVIGKCNSCEEKDESKFWRWEESPIPDSPNTQINPINMDTRRADPGDLQPKDFPNPVVNIQNAPNVPDPTGLAGILQLIGKSDSFRDLTGLTENQKNALATLQKSLDTAQAFGKEASSLAKTAGMIDLIKNAKNDGNLSKEDAQSKTAKAVDAGTQPTFEEKVERTRKQLEVLKGAFDAGNIDAEQLSALSEGLLKDSTVGDSTGLTPGDVAKMTQNAKQNQANVNLKTDAGEVEIDTQPRTLRRLTRDGDEEVETTGMSGSDGTLFEQPANAAAQTLFTVRNRVNQEVVRNCTVAIENQPISGVTGNQGGVRLDLSALPDGDYKLIATPAAVHNGATYSGVGDPATNPPDRIWEGFSASFTKQGNLLSSADPNLAILNNRVTVKLKPVWMKTPNQIARPNGVTPSMIIVHHTGSTRAGTPLSNNGPLDSLLDGNSPNHAGAHYIIGRDGLIIKLAHESRDANHAYTSHWGGQNSVGGFSIGIEILHSNNGPNGEVGQYVEDFTSDQYDSLLLLLTDLTQAYSIPVHRVVGHADIATNAAGTLLGRKSSDPGKMFDWATVEAHGFGLIATGGMVHLDTEYGGFFDQFPTSSLRSNDRDSTHRFGGVVRPALTAAIIRELQTDLRSIGYACPLNGVYDLATSRAVMIFNEHYFSGSRQIAGKSGDRVDMDTANAIKGIVRTLESI